MALMKCKECGGEVSTSASACPKCGAPVVLAPGAVKRIAKGVGYVLAGMILLLVVAGIAVSKKPETARAANMPARVVAPPFVPAAAPVRPAPPPIIPPPAPGIGIAQPVIRVAMEKIGYAFEPGLNQVMGKNASGTAYCQLLGDPRDLESAGMMLASKAEPTAAIANMTAVAIFAKAALPDWPDGAAWIFKALGGKAKHAAIQHGTLTVEVNDHSTELGILTVSVKRTDAM